MHGASNQIGCGILCLTDPASLLSKTLHHITNRSEWRWLPDFGGPAGGLSDPIPFGAAPTHGVEERIDPKLQLSKCAIPIFLTLIFSNALPPLNLSRWTAYYRCASIISMTGKRAK